jgi:hypothetical protein
MPHYEQYQADSVSAMQPYAYNQYQQSGPSSSFSTLQNQHQHQQQQFNRYANHQGQNYQQHGYIASDAWRQWAESARTYDMNGTPAPQQDYMSTANTMVSLGGHQDHGGGMQIQGGADHATYGMNANNGGMRHQAGPFPHMIQDATMHAALAAQGWSIPDGHHFAGHAGVQGHGHGM